MANATKPRPPRHSRLALDGAMTIYRAENRKTALLKALGNAAELEIDLSGVEEMDTAGLQLLLLVKREADRAGKTLRLVEHSAASLEVLDRYNLAAYFGDPVVLVSERK